MDPIGEAGEGEVFGLPGLLGGDIQRHGGTVASGAALSRLSVASQRDTAINDDEELQRAALEKAFASKLASKQAVLFKGADGWQVVTMRRMKSRNAQALLDKVASVHHGQVDAQAEPFLRLIRERLDRVGVSMPSVEVRFKELTVTARVEKPREEGGRPSLKRQLTGAGQTKTPLVDAVSGVLRPGRYTLLLGPPGSGKTLLMRALAGQLKSEKNLKVTAEEVTVNGRSFDQFVLERSLSYISQLDQHIAELTVRETLDFSARCQGPSKMAELLELVKAREAERGIVPDPDVAAFMDAMAATGKQSMQTQLMLRLLGLDVCEDTVVGSAMLRGISGGQKKRVTTGEMLVGPVNAVLADEISTGLDSSTTFEICKSLRAVCHLADSVFLVALLQPAPETVDLFDDVMMMTRGRIVYHGPREGVLPFFQGLGFACPPSMGVADFLQGVTTRTDQRAYWAGPADEYKYVRSQDIAAAFYQTQAGASMLEELDRPFQPSDIAEVDPLHTEKYGRPWPQLLRATLSRGWTLQNRTLPFFIFREVQTVFMAFVLGTLFLQQPKETVADGQAFLGVLFMLIILTFMGGFPDAVLMVQRLPVFYKQRDAHMYPGWVFALSEFALRLPWLFLDAWLWTVMLYFMVGFVTSVRILAFWGIVMAIQCAGTSMVMAIGAIMRQQSRTSAVMVFILLILIATSGFVITKSWMWGGWLAAYWANPIAYFLKALCINEMTSSDWDTPLAGTPFTVGEAVLYGRGMPPDYYYVWIAIFAWGVGGTVLNLSVLAWALSALSALKGKRQLVEDDENAPLPHTSGAGSPLSAGSPLDKSSPAGASGPAAPGGKPGAGDAVDLEAGAGGGAHASGSLPFRPLAMAFKGLKYSVPIPKESSAPPSEDPDHAGQLLLLKGITGAFRPGVLTALMGASGAGKTTLMDCLAGRKTEGRITGDVYLNGFPLDNKAFARVMGYVEQTDVHVPEATVAEALQFSAALRLPATVSAATRKAFVQEVMDLVELAPIAGKHVGLPGEGLSVEQRKRLTIGVELVANPSIVFMDEPTSGLDARAAMVVMRAVKNIANSGRTVVCTIHQPSHEIFMAFDDLLLLKRGGETIYAGPIGRDASAMAGYLGALPGVSPLPVGQNPANWMLDETTPDAEASRGCDYAELFNKSQPAAEVERQVAELSTPKEGAAPLRLSDLRTVSALTQLRWLFWRHWKAYPRNVSYNGTRIFVTLVIACCFGSLYQGKGTELNDYLNVISIAGAIYITVLFLGATYSMTLLDVVSINRTVYYREHASGTYGNLPYSLAEILIEVPWCTVLCAVYSVIVYWWIGFAADAAKFFWFFFFFWLTLIYFVMFGILSIHVTPTLQLGHAMAVMLFGLFNIFCGFLKPPSMIGSGWIWAYWANPVSWSLYGLVTSQLGDVQTLIVIPGEGEVTVASFINSYFGFKHSWLGYVVLMLFGYALIFAGLAFFALKKLNFQKR